MKLKTGMRVSVIVLVVLSLSMVFAVSAVDATVVRVDPASQTVSAGDSFSVNVRVEDVTYMAMADADLNFEQNAMQATDIIEGDFLKSVPGGGGTLKVEIKDNTNGIVTFGYALMKPGVGAYGSGTLATINFNTNPAVEGVFNLNLTNVVLLDGDGNEITVDEIISGKVILIPLDITITSPENRTYASKCVRLNFTVEPEGTVLDWIGYSLDGGANVTIAGNTTVFDELGESAPYDHNIVVYANDTDGNMAASNIVYFTIHPADINGDCRVYVSDLLLLAQAYNSRPGDANWNPDADLDCSNRVYTADLLILAQNYNKVYSKKGKPGLSKMQMS